MPARRATRRAARRAAARPLRALPPRELLHLHLLHITWEWLTSPPARVAAAFEAALARLPDATRPHLWLRYVHWEARGVRPERVGRGGSRVRGQAVGATRAQLLGRCILDGMRCFAPPAAAAGANGEEGVAVALTIEPAKTFFRDSGSEATSEAASDFACAAASLCWHNRRLLRRVVSPAAAPARLSRCSRRVRPTAGWNSGRRRQSDWLKGAHHRYGARARGGRSVGGSVVD